ncbi:RagB/SusD family nutrient uptake outer membrane protein [Bacteroides faecium]|uniref:RagB/SusD family nutrient uptake outer membrane protein n=1 Tax=Bacteroides faecium TaxID=2715212 RepID=A0A6H0KLI8_9BACE|nr:RagB/SusD family nutrient uptake outer membrane protein [Bacteroides faecium]QIU93227.1 RagB/SusD family nutrient uptake outer membrane protein [Bacteroides faecium]
MKNKIRKFIALGIVAIFSLSSCSDYLDKEPDDQLTLETVFENKTNMERWLAYIYNATPKFYNYDGADAVADELAPSVGWESQGFKAILYQNGNWTSASGGVINYWETFPMRIRQAYIFIKYAHALPDVTEKEVNYMKAECRFFIAYFHAVMAMTYGAVPIIRDATEEITGETLLLKQEPFNTVVDWAANELLETSKLLPAYYDEDNKYGRITSIICLAMRARLLTFAASPLVNGNQDPDMVNMKNCDGVSIFDSTFKPERWKAAVDANKLLIDEAEKAGHKLYIETIGDDVDAFQSYQNALMLRYNQGNMEILFPRTYDDAGYFDRQANPRSMGGAGAIGVTQSLVDAFFMRNGLAPITGYTNDGATPNINPESGYSETGYSTVDESYKTTWMYATKGGTEQETEHVIVPKNTYKMYCGREPRFYISVLYNEEYHWGKDKSNAKNKFANFFSGGEDGGPSHDSPSAGYLIRKRVDPSAIPASSSGTYKKRQGVLYRLAEAYLSYAESLYEYSVATGTYTDNETEILDYINRVRYRAGIPQYGKGMDQIPVTEAQLRDLIRRERRVELNCEAGIRFDDLRRWKEAETALNGKFYGMNALAKSTERDEYYKRTLYQTRRFISYWWPIPQDDIDKNTNLRQLPGWWR